MNIRKPVDYSELYVGLDELLKSDMQQMKMFCEIGKLVDRRPEKGAAVAAAEYIHNNYPDRQGFSPRSLRRMREFYRAYKNDPALMNEAMKISWSLNAIIVENCESKEERAWFIQAVQTFGWPKTKLVKMIQKNAHECSSLNHDQEEYCIETEYAVVRECKCVDLPCAERNHSSVMEETEMEMTTLTSLEIERMANEMLMRHSFEVSSFEEAKVTISFRGVQCCFDRLSLCVYSHDLTSDEYFKLGRILTSRYEEQFDREERKTRQEYAVLFYLMAMHGYYADMKITKKTRPDFELSGHEKIGIEVTELTTPQDRVLAAISRQNFGRGKSAEEIRKHAIKKHGAKADSYKYLDLEGTIAVGIELFDVSEKHQQYADEIIKKFNLYKNMFHLYDRFVILCDGQEAMCLTTEEDSEEILMLAKNKVPDIHGFTLHILRTDDFGQCKIDSFAV